MDIAKHKERMMGRLKMETENGLNKHIKVIEDAIFPFSNIKYA